MKLSQNMKILQAWALLFVALHSNFHLSQVSQVSQVS